MQCSLILFHQDELSQDLLNFAAESLRDGGRLVFLAGRPAIAMPSYEELD